MATDSLSRAAALLQELQSTGASAERRIGAELTKLFAAGLSPDTILPSGIRLVAAFDLASEVLGELCVKGGADPAKPIRDDRGAPGLFESAILNYDLRRARRWAERGAPTVIRDTSDPIRAGLVALALGDQVQLAKAAKGKRVAPFLLAIAIEQRDLESLTQLLDSGVDVNCRIARFGESGRAPPLSFLLDARARQKGAGDRWMETLKLLLARGADPGLQNPETKLTSLEEARRARWPDAVELLEKRRS